MAMDVAGFIKNRFGNPTGARGTGRGDAYVSKRLPDFSALVQEGKVFSALDTTTTVALVARPSTLGSLTVQNPTGSGKHYVIFELLIYTDVVPATLGLVTVWHCVHKLTTAAFTRDLVLTGTGAGSATSLKAGINYNGQAIFDRGATVVDDGWVPTPLTNLNNIATTNFISNAAKLTAPVIIPEGHHYSLQTTATVVTFESALGMLFAELDPDDLKN